MNRTANVVFWVGCCLSIAVGDATHAEPTCALIDATKLPVSALLEARLIASDGAKWVERTEIDRILGERNLQSAFGAEGVRSRSSLGDLLKADVLVLLRSAKSPDQAGPPLLDCVICETKRGLRLRSASFPQEKDPEATVKSLEELVRSGLKKYEEKIETVVAVPPFLSEDLGYDLNYLQTAYAKLVEQTLLAQPGLLVVELGEAQAIGRELTIADEGAVVRTTKPPLYVIGRYRHDAGEKQRTLRMSLRLLQSDKQLTLKGVRALPPQEGPEWILTKTMEMLPIFQSGKIAAEPADPKAEARAIADRGRLFHKVGSWTEALALYEASLLLNPEQEAVRLDAVSVITPQIRALFPMDRSLENATKGIALGDRGLEHLEAFLKTAQDISKYKAVDDRDFALEFDGQYSAALHIRNHRTEDIIQLMKIAQKKRTETLLRIAYARGKAGIYDRTDNNAWDARAVNFIPDTEQYAIVLRIAEDWKDLPDLDQRIVRMTFRDFAWISDTPALQDLLKRLSASDRAELRSAAEKIKVRYETGKAAKERYSQRKPPPEVADVDPRLEELKLGGLGSGWYDETIPGVSGFDILRKDSQLFTLRDSGRAEPFYTYPKQFFYNLSTVYDGKYVWYGGNLSQKGLVLYAIDVNSGKEFRLTQDHGLPNLDFDRGDLKLAAVTPGKVCVIGFTGQTWAAVVEFKNGEPKGKVFFEARETASGTDPSQLKNVKLAFRPTAVFRLGPVGEKDCRLVVGRRTDGALTAAPLIIDPIDETASVAKFTAPGWDHGGVQLAGASHDTLFFYESGFPRHPTLMSVRYPCEAKEKFLEDCPEGRLVFTRDGLNIIGKQWHVVDLSTRERKTEVEKVGWFFTTNWAYGTGENPNFGVNFNQTTMLAYVHNTVAFGPVVETKKGPERKFYRLNRRPQSP